MTIDDLVGKMTAHVRADVEGEKYPDLARLCSYLEMAYTLGLAHSRKFNYCAGYKDAIRGDDPEFEDWNDDS